MLLAPLLGEPPRAVAERLGAIVTERLGDDLDRVEVAGPGFLNLFLSGRWFRRALAAAAGAGDDYGRGSPARPERVLVEFVSANPTGPANAATGRHAAYGDSLARILAFAGHEVGARVLRERLRLAGAPLRRVDPRACPRRGAARGRLPGRVRHRARRRRSTAPPTWTSATSRTRGVELMIGEVRATLERYRVVFDRFFYEHEVYDVGRGRAHRRAARRARPRVRERGRHMAAHLHARRRQGPRARRARRARRPTSRADIAYHQDKRAPRVRPGDRRAGAPTTTATPSG